jgi:hypothetical protein
MSRQRVWLLGLSLVLPLAVAAVFCQADEPKKDADKKELTAEDTDRALEEIALAYRLADAGRKAGSPEALLGAAKILSRLNGKEIGLVKLEGVKPLPLKGGDDKKKIKPGEPIKEDGGKPTSFAAEIKKLKEDARKLNTPRNEKLAELIDAVDERGRGSFGGPKWMGPFTVKLSYPHQPFTFRFRANQPAHILVRNKSGVKLHLSIVEWDDGPSGEVVDEICEIEGTSNLEWRWTPTASHRFAVDIAWPTLDSGEGEFEIFKN